MTERRLTPTRLAQMQECFEQALGFEPGDRERFLVELRERDAELAESVRRIIKAHLSTGPELRSPIAHGPGRATGVARDEWVGGRGGGDRVVRRLPAPPL